MTEETETLAMAALHATVGHDLDRAFVSFRTFLNVVQSGHFSDAKTWHESTEWWIARSERHAAAWDEMKRARLKRWRRRARRK